MPNVKILLNININIYIVYAFFILTNYLTDRSELQILKKAFLIFYRQYKTTKEFKFN